MSQQKTLKQPDEDWKKVVYDYTYGYGALPVKRKNTAKKSTPLAFDEPFLWTLAGKVGKDWKRLAGWLNFGQADIAQYAEKGTPNEQAYRLLVSWWRKQVNAGHATKLLTSALVQSGHRDFVGMIPGYAHTSTGASIRVHSKLSSEHQSITNVDMLRNLAARIPYERAWKQLAITLDIQAAQIQKFEEDSRNLTNTAFVMLLYWWEKQMTPKEAAERLKEALSKLGQADLVKIISGYAHTSTGASMRDKVHSKLSSKHQSITDVSVIDVKMLRVVAASIGSVWKQLATTLDIQAAQIQKFEEDIRYATNTAFVMLLYWWEKQMTPKEATDRLKKELSKLSRDHLVKKTSVATHSTSRHPDVRKRASESPALQPTSEQKRARPGRLLKNVKSLEKIEESLWQCKPLKFYWAYKMENYIAMTAATLKELRTKIQTNKILGAIGDDFKIVLKEDCTRIEDEDHFKTLPDNAVLVVLNEGEEWEEAIFSLESNRAFFEVDGEMTQEERYQRVDRVKRRFRKNPGLSVLVKKDGLEVLSKSVMKPLGGKEENLPKRKPLKICRVKERTRIGVVAATLKELRTKIQTQFPSIGDDFKIVLEEDCTRIEDENYFKTLPDNAVLVVVSEREQWTGASSSLEEEFSMGFVEADGKMSQGETTPTLAQVAGKIAENPALLAFLPKVDLEVMADADLNELQVLLHQTKDKAEFIQDACERRLLDITASNEARELLNLYHRAKTREGESLAKTEGRSLVKTEGRSPKRDTSPCSTRKK